MLNCTLFSTIVPIIPFFAAAYFYIKYQVDKHNLLFVYFAKQESLGRVKNTVLNHMLFNLFAYMIIIDSFFTLKFKECFGGLYGMTIPFFWAAIYYIADKHWHEKENAGHSVHDHEKPLHPEKDQGQS